MCRPVIVGSPDPLYRLFLETFSGNEFNNASNRMALMLDAEALKASTEQQEAMRQRFMAACRMEWMFWDASYRLEGWPL